MFLSTVRHDNLSACHHISLSVPAISQGLASTLFSTLLRSKRMLMVKNLHINSGSIRDSDSVPQSGRYAGGGHENPLQNSCLENPMDRGAWWATVYRVAESDMTEATKHTHTHTHTITERVDTPS